MKILIPILGFGRSGGNRVLSELANAWISQGHSVDFLCPDSSDEPYFPTSAGVMLVDGTGSVVRAPGNKAKPSGWYHLRSLFLGLKAIGLQYDVIFANHSLTAWPVALAPCGTARKIYYVQAYEPEYYSSSKTLKGGLMALLSAATYHLPLKRVVNSPIYFCYKNLRAFDFVPPGVDLEIFRPTGFVKDLKTTDSIVIGCIGRKEPEKGTIYALRAFEKIHQNDKRFVLRVAYGNLPKNWKHDSCEVIVPRNDNELAEYYRSLDILIAPGTSQHGAPHYPVLEAGASGAAVVTTGYMGATEETAWIVKNKDVDSIVSAVKEIAVHGPLRKKRRDQFLEEIANFSWDRVSRRMLAIFEG